MSTVGQIGHVLTKDLRQARWVLVVYLGIVLIATANSVVWSSPLNNVLDMGIVAVVVLGMLSVASFIQADSPTQTNAFWASQPLAPMSVLGAKVLLAVVVVIAIPLIGQALGLAAHGVRSDHLPRLLLQSTSEYGGWVLFAMIIAALTRDLRTFLLALVLTPIVLLIVSAVLVAPRVESHFRFIGVSFHTLALFALFGGVVGGLALLTVLYIFRDSRRYTWALGAFCAACSLLWIGGPLTGVSSSRPEPYSGPKPTFSLNLSNPQTASLSPRFNLDLETQVPENAGRLSLTNLAATVYVRHGKPIPISLFTQGGTLNGVGAFGVGPGGAAQLSLPTFHLDSGTHWLGREQPRSVGRALSAQLTEEQMADVASGVDSVNLDGVVVVETPSVLGTLPLTVGATLTRNAVRARIQSWVHGSGQANLSVEQWWIPLADSRAVWQVAGNEERDFALWNPDRREAIAVAQRGVSSGSGWLVLPGASVVQRRSDFEPAFAYGPSGRIPQVEDSWYDGAKLLVIEWTYVGSYPFRVTTVGPR